MFEFPYLIEMLSPRTDAGEKTEHLLERFAKRYAVSLDAGCGVSVPDNPMGRKRMGLLDCISATDLKVIPEKVVMNLNTFHTRDELDDILETACRHGIVNLLLIKGDGGPELSVLDPASIGGKYNVATTVDLLNYINSEYADKFNTGVAFNPYKNSTFETNHLQKKIDAGAKFIITQPIIGQNKNVDALAAVNLPLVVEAWMSMNVSLFYKSIGKTVNELGSQYDPMENLDQLHRIYPSACVYLAMFNFSEEWQSFLPRLAD